MITKEFEKHLRYLLGNEIDNGKIEFSYLQGKHTIVVSIEVAGDYGKSLNGN